MRQPMNSPRHAAYETFGDALGRMGAEEFTGRTFELQYMERMLAARDGPEKLLHLSGIGGIGKTALLERFRTTAAQAGAVYCLVDMRDCLGNAELFLSELERQLDLAGCLEAEEAAERTKAVLAAVNRMAGERKVVLALDQYEEVGGLDQWLRDSFLPGLHAGTLIVMAGRHPPGRAWMLSSLWRKLSVSLPLSELDYGEVQAYLAKQGLTDPDTMDRIWLESAGHPLTLSLLASIAASPGSRPELRRDTLAELLRSWLEEASEADLRELVYAASVPRSFDQDLLLAITDGGISGAQFERLTGLSFVGRTPKGWQLHGLVRDAVRQALRERMPDTFRTYRQRTVEALRARIGAAGPSARADSAWEVAELLSQVGNPILRAHFRHSRSSGNYWETVTADSLSEAEAYIERRYRTAKPLRIACSDPEDGTSFRYEMTAEESLLRLKGWNVRELAAFGGEPLRLLRNPEGEAVGLSAILPIHRGTLPYLSRNPLSAAYFRTLTPEELSRMETGEERPAGRFILAVDVLDLAQKDLRSDIVHTVMEHILAGSLLITSPPPLPYYADSHRSMGYRTVPDAEHDAYGCGDPAPVYLLDTRSRPWTAYLDLATLPLAPGPAVKEAGFVSKAPFALTAREQEVAGLLVTGLTNAEIAKRLYISEAAVKKHINAMLRKSGLKNRTQLAAGLLESAVEPC